jgi:4-hydroxy-tetrahydrodipicolinate reductase
MVRIIIHGAGGRMGQAVAAAAAASPDIEVVAGVDRVAPSGKTAFPVFPSLAQCDREAQVVIDFSSPSALPALLETAAARKLPLIVATTGLSPEDKARLAEAATSIPVFLSANMSLGISVMCELAQKAATVLGPEFDIEIVEKHHNLKKDAPSGTALLLAEAINEVFLGGKTLVYGRHGREEPRKERELGIHAVRAGTIVGEHEVLFAGRDEVVELRHSAASRQIFALGALRAARYLAGRPPGLYSMKDMINAASAVTRLYVSDEEALISLGRVPFDPMRISDVFRRIGERNITIDMISQTAPEEGEVSVTFTLFLKDLDKAEALLGELQKSMPRLTLAVRKDITKIAVEGPGMETQSGVAARVFAALARDNVAVQSVTTSETKIALVIGREHRDRATASIKETFGL